jgi:catechol 2,3-dioxygenase-like lactoylglutathione lyase family enzyme
MVDTPVFLRSHTPMKTVAVVLAVAALAPSAVASAQSTPAAPSNRTVEPRQALTRAAEVLVPDSLNVFRRFTADGPKTLAFYGEVLGLKTLQPIGQVYRFQVGTSEVKFSPAARNRPIARGGMDAAAGMRLWTFRIADEAALAARFIQHGYAAPAFKMAGAARTALVADPDGEIVQLLVVPAGSPDLAKLDIGIAANDLEKSRIFYRSFVGLQELPPVDDPLLGVRRFPFRHGTTTVNVWASGGGKPLNPSLAGIQYVVRDVNAVDALARQHAVPVETPLGETMPGLRTVWLYDPDQVTNYFAEIRPRQPRE